MVEKPGTGILFSFLVFLSSSFIRGGSARRIESSKSHILFTYSMYNFEIKFCGTVFFFGSQIVLVPRASLMCF